MATGSSKSNMHRNPMIIANLTLLTPLRSLFLTNADVFLMFFIRQEIVNGVIQG